MSTSLDVGFAPPAPAPLGHKGPRAAILTALKRAQRLTATELAQRLGASLNAVRHHLKELETESLVAYERERRGVGAPVFAYRLTPAGEGLFPRRYEGTLMQVLDQVVEREGRSAAAALLSSQFDALAERLEPLLAHASPDARLELVTRALADEGFMAEWEDAGAGPALVEHNCAILAVAERFPEVCEAERRFLSATLGAAVERRSHIVSGCGACRYTVRFASRVTRPNKENG
jgi:DeoR family suf operon transcriptional repressor